MRARAAQMNLEPLKAEDAVEDYSCVLVQRDPSFVMELAKWNMKSPLVSAQMTQGVPVQAEAFADPHSGSANQKKGIGEEIIGLA